MKRGYWILLGSLLGVAVLAAIFGNLFLQRYLAGEEFRELISSQTSRVFRVNGEYSPLRWTGSDTYSESFQGIGAEGSPVLSLQAQRIRASFNWRAVWAGGWRLDDLSIGSLAVEFGEAGKAVQPNPTESGGSGLESLPGWIPRRFEIDAVAIESADLRTPHGAILGTRVEGTKDGGAWILSARDGKVEVEGLPKNSIDRISARVGFGALFITDCTLRLEPTGTMKCDGEFHEDSGRFTLRAQWENVDSQSVLPERLQKHLSGLLAGKATFTGNPEKGEVPSAKGNFVLTEGLLEQVPALRTLARFTNSPQFERVSIQELSGEFQQEPGGIRVRNFVMESRGLMKIEGEFFLAHDDSLTGSFLVGLTPQTLRWLPGSRNQVFTEFRAGYHWTPVEVGGTSEKPSENLSARLVAAMGTEVIQTGEKVLDESTNTAIEGVKTVLDILTPLLP